VTALTHRGARRPITLPLHLNFRRAFALTVQTSASYTHTKSTARRRQDHGRRHNDEEILVLGNADCGSYGCISDVSSRRIAGYDCGANRDQSSRIVGDGTEDGFRLAQHLHQVISLLRASWHCLVNLPPYEFVLVRREVIDVCSDGRAPAHTRCSQ
jgi:hypothetical protein